MLIADPAGLRADSSGKPLRWRARNPRRRAGADAGYACHRKAKSLKKIGMDAAQLYTADGNIRMGTWYMADTKRRLQKQRSPRHRRL